MDETRKARIRLAVAGTVTVLMAIGLVPLVVGATRRHNQPSVPRATGIAVSSSTVSTPPPASDTSGSADLRRVYEPPRTTDAVGYARAYAVALLTYDTRSESLAAYRAATQAWVQPINRSTDSRSMLADFLPNVTTWKAMSSAGQSQTVTVANVWIPGSVQLARAQHKAAYAAQGDPWVVTVTLTQHLVYDRTTKSDIPRTLSVIVLCDGHKPCSAFAPGRSVVTE